MSEKVLHEIKIIETDDGFRIEMTGDKEELRKLLFEQGKPFFMPFGRGRHFGGRGRGQGFGGHGPFGHHEHGQQEQGAQEHGQHGHGPFGRHHEHGQHEHGPFGRHEHGQHEHGQHEHGHDPREHMRPPFEGRERPTHEEGQNLHYFFRRFGGGRGGWKAKRGGYDLGPWWDESSAPSDDAPTQV